MSNVRLIAVECQISRANISDSRGFVILGPHGERIYSGIAPQYYFWDNNKIPVLDDQPAVGDTLNGYVAARYIGDDSQGLRLISIPDGTVTSVPREQRFIMRPEREPEGVPV